MRVSTRVLIAILLGSSVGILLMTGVTVLNAQDQTKGRPTIATEADFRKAMKELSNWGRWGNDDELGASNLITAAKRKQALALGKEGLTISLAHDVVQETAAPGSKAPAAPGSDAAGRRRSSTRPRAIPDRCVPSRAEHLPHPRVCVAGGRGLGRGDRLDRLSRRHRAGPHRSHPGRLLPV